MLVTEKRTKNLSFLRMVGVLRKLREQKVITEAEYRRAKKYYQRLMGADIAIVD